MKMSSIGYALRELGCLVRVEHNREKLPETEMYLESVDESREQELIPHRWQFIR